MNRLFVLLLAGAFLVWCASVAFKSQGPSPEVVVEELLGPVSGATEVDGFVRKGDTYEVQVRFLAEEDFVYSLPHRGFRETDCQAVRLVIRFSLLRVAAYPLWTPDELIDAVCFQRDAENRWSPRGRDVLLYSPSTGWVYFASEGREHDRAMPEGSGFRP